MIREFLVAAVCATALCRAATVTTGKPWNQTAHFGLDSEVVYYIRDMGDGRWVPGARGIARYPATESLVWWKPGEYRALWMGVSLSGESRQGKEETVVVKGKAVSPGERLVPVEIEGLEGNTSTEPYQASAATLQFDGLKRLEWLVLAADGDGTFPMDFHVQTSPDGGKHWHRTMSAEFAFFPDPGKNAVWIPLRGVAADALRIVVPRGNPLDDGRYGWKLRKATAIGGEHLPWTAAGASPLELAAWNNLWLNFGLAANEVHERFDSWWQTERPLDGGMRAMGSTLWFYWNAQKLSWLGHSADIERLESSLARIEVSEDGYVWAAPGHEKHLGHSRHYGTNASFIRAVAHHFLLTRDETFLNRKDPDTGQTILEKARRAMQFQTEVLQGATGLLVIQEPTQDGTPTSLGSNYWDFWLFGHKSAYDNAVFYETLRLMAELEEALGETSRASELRDLRRLVKDKFNETFWSETTGRYIGWEDVHGIRYDYGFTDLNLQALHYGLADKDRAKSVLDWLDGTRKVEGDDAHDIYHFGFAPRSTTVSALRGEPPVVNTWGGELDIRDGESAGFGQQIQNGGAIFYPSYHDLHARLRVRGANDAHERWAGIVSEFQTDALRRDPDNFRAQTDVLGILREFPESGVVPYFFIDGFLGIAPVAGGLRIAPALPTDWKSARVDEFHFAGASYEIIADRSVVRPTVARQVITVPARGAWLFTPDGKIAQTK